MLRWDGGVSVIYIVDTFMAAFQGARREFLSLCLWVLLAGSCAAVMHPAPTVTEPFSSSPSSLALAFAASSADLHPSVLLHVVGPFRENDTAAWRDTADRWHRALRATNAWHIQYVFPRVRVPGELLDRTSRLVMTERSTGATVRNVSLRRLGDRVYDWRPDGTVGEMSNCPTVCGVSPYVTTESASSSGWLDSIRLARLGRADTTIVLLHDDIASEPIHQDAAVWRLRALLSESLRSTARSLLVVGAAVCGKDSVLKPSFIHSLPGFLPSDRMRWRIVAYLCASRTGGEVPALLLHRDSPIGGLRTGSVMKDNTTNSSISSSPSSVAPLETEMNGRLVRFRSPEGLPRSKPPGGLFLLRQPQWTSPEKPAQPHMTHIPESCMSRLLANPIQRIGLPLHWDNETFWNETPVGTAVPLRVGLATPLVRYLLCDHSVGGQGPCDPSLRRTLTRGLIARLQSSDANNASISAWVSAASPGDWVPPPIPTARTGWRKLYAAILGNATRSDRHALSRVVVEDSAANYLFRGTFTGWHATTILIPVQMSLFVSVVTPLAELLSDAGMSVLLVDSDAPSANVDAVTNGSATFAANGRWGAFLFTRKQEWRKIPDLEETPYITWNLEYQGDLLESDAFHRYTSRAAVRLDYSRHTIPMYAPRVAEGAHPSRRHRSIRHSSPTDRVGEPKQVLHMPICFHPSMDFVTRRDTSGRDRICSEPVPTFPVSHFGSRNAFTPRRNRILDELRHVRLQSHDDNGDDEDEDGDANDDSASKVAHLRVATCGHFTMDFCLGYLLWQVSCAAPISLNVHAYALPGAAVLELTRLLPLAVAGTTLLVSEQGTPSDAAAEAILAVTNASEPQHVFLSPRDDPLLAAADIGQVIQSFATDHGRAESLRRAERGRASAMEQLRCEKFSNVAEVVRQVTQVLPVWAWLHCSLSCGTGERARNGSRGEERHDPIEQR